MEKKTVNNISINSINSLETKKKETGLKSYITSYEITRIFEWTTIANNKQSTFASLEQMNDNK